MRLLKHAPSIALLSFVVFIVTCKKNDAAKERIGNTPVAIAGQDTAISLLSCNDQTGSVELDGNRSFDPGHTQLIYKWRKVMGPETYYIDNSNSAKAEIQNLGVGTYMIELLVKNETGIASRDTLKLVAGYKATPIDLDASLNSDYSFTDNYHDAYGDNYDVAYFSSLITIPGHGDFSVDFYESSDIPNSSLLHQTGFHLYNGNANNTYLSGDCSVNFKRVIVTGGGTFSGTISINDASALICDPLAISKMSLLNISGTVDTTTKKVTISIQGKVLF